MPDPLDGLDPRQREAVTHPGGPLLVEGEAGTGKSYVLAHRVAWLVRQGHAADGLLVLAQAPRAAAALRARVEGLLELPWEELWVCTPVECAERILREEAAEADVDPLFVLVSAADRMALLLERIDELTLRRHEIRGSPAPLIAGFVRRIDSLKHEGIACAGYVAYAEELVSVAKDDAERAHARRELEFARLYADHDRLVSRSGALDAGETLLRVVGLLREHPHVRARLGRRFGHLLVDDHQDLGPVGARLVALLTAEHANLSVAGDPAQSVRRLRGAAQKNRTDLLREHPALRVVCLNARHRSSPGVMRAARAVEPSDGRAPSRAPGRRRAPGVRFWHCHSERAQAQAVATEAERLIAVEQVAPERIGVLVPTRAAEANLLATALEERAVPFRLAGAGTYLQRPEVRDVLAWLRLLANPEDSGAVVRALSRPPVELRSVDIARLTQLARRRKLDMVSAVLVALEGPQLSPEGRDQARAFLALHRSAARAFEEMHPDLFVHRLLERVGVRRRTVLSARGDTAERLRGIARVGELASAYMRREPQATARNFVRYLTAVAEAGLPEDDVEAEAGAVRVMALDDASFFEWDHVFVIGLGAVSPRQPADGIPDALLQERLPPDDRLIRDERSQRRLHTGMTRARQGLVLAWAEGPATRPSPLYSAALSACKGHEEEWEEELFGPTESLHSTFRMMRDELLDSVSSIGGRLGEMRLDTYLDVSQGVVRYLELLKLAALMERQRGGQPLDVALPEVNDLISQAASPDQLELFRASALDAYLRDTDRTVAARAELLVPAATEASLEPFIPRRGGGLMLSASDIETYRRCPLKYKFARVFRIPQEPTINQRFGILVHQVLERFHSSGGGSLEYLMQLFEASWRRCGFGDRNDDLQFRARAVESLHRYWDLDRERTGDPVWFERGFSFRIGPHLLRGRVDRVDRLPDGGYELIDYKTGRAKTSEDLRQDLQLSLYQMGARESWQLATSAQSYYYVLENEKVPVEHSEAELERVEATVATIAEGISNQRFEPRPSPEDCAACDYRIICPAAET